MLLVFGGMDNSSLASTWTGARLLSTPRALVAVVEEQKQILRDYGDQHVDYNAFLKMNTLHWSIKEALRMHPPPAVFLRKVQKNFTVQTKDGREYEIPRGNAVASPVPFNSHLPHTYKD